MNQSPNFFERLIQFAQSEGIMNANQLAKYLGYGSSEKISRLGRGKNTKPGFDLLVDLANKFENAPLYWLITGKGSGVKPFNSFVDNEEQLQANEPLGSYQRLPAKHSIPSDETSIDSIATDGNPLLQDLLDEKDRVIATLQELIEAQKDTIALLKEEREK